MKMKTMIALAALVPLLAAGCASPSEPRYAGSPGSVYDKERDPPQAVTPQLYDPMAPQKPLDFGNGGAPAPAVALR
jgi:hypothetical protein